MFMCCEVFCYWCRLHGGCWTACVTERKHVHQSLQNNSLAGCRRWKEMGYYKAVFPAPSTEKCKQKWWTTEEQRGLSGAVHVTGLNQSQWVIPWQFILEKTWFFVSKHTPAAKSNSQSLLKMFLIYPSSSLIQWQWTLYLLLFCLAGGSESSYPAIPGG